MMKVPQFKDPAVTKFLTEYLRDLDRASKDVLYSNKANGSLLLQTSNNRVYRITVDEDGTLVSTKIAGPA